MTRTSLIIMLAATAALAGCKENHTIVAGGPDADNDASAEARKAMADAISSGLPTSCRLTFSRPDLMFGFSHSMGVSTAPGRMQLTRIPLGLPSIDAERVSDTTAALAAA